MMTATEKIRIFLLFLISWGGGSTVAIALPVFNQNECVQANIADWPNKDKNGQPSQLQNYSKGDPIYFYIESDFGAELKSCLSDPDVTNNTSQFKNISSTQANKKIKNAIRGYPVTVDFSVI